MCRVQWAILVLPKDSIRKMSSGGVPNSCESSDAYPSYSMPARLMEDLVFGAATTAAAFPASAALTACTPLSNWARPLSALISPSATGRLPK